MKYKCVVGVTIMGVMLAMIVTRGCDPMFNDKFHHDPPILSYARFRYVCDHCDWDTGDHERLSQAILKLNDHRGAHDPKPTPRPAPKKISEILDNVRKIR